MITTDKTHTHYGTGSGALLNESDEQIMPQSTESKLKTILFGTPKQREARYLKFVKEFEEHTKRALTRTLFESGYITKLAIYSKVPLPVKTRVAGIGFDLLRTSTELYGVGLLATKLGEYFAQ